LENMAEGLPWLREAASGARKLADLLGPAWPTLAWDDERPYNET
jgi:hypothetical protein